MYYIRQEQSPFHINFYSIPLAIIIPESMSPNLVMAAAARVVPSLRSVINALVPTQDGRSVSSDQMDAFQGLIQRGWIGWLANPPPPSLKIIIYEY
jgi:hypothetical protein